MCLWPWLDAFLSNGSVSGKCKMAPSPNFTAWEECLVLWNLENGLPALSVLVLKLVIFNVCCCPLPPRWCHTCVTKDGCCFLQRLAMALMTGLLDTCAL